MLHRLRCPLVALSCVLAGAAVGCSHASNQPALITEDDSGIPGSSPAGGGGGAGSDAGVRDGAIVTADSGDAAVVCNGLSLMGVPVTEQVSVADALPAATGGTILDGTYLVTKSDLYNGAAGTVGLNGVLIRAVYVFSGSKLESYVELTINGVASRATSTANYTTALTTVSVSSTCPRVETITDGYSVINATTLVLITPAKEVRTLTKQP